MKLNPHRIKLDEAWMESNAIHIENMTTRLLAITLNLDNL